MPIIQLKQLSYTIITTGDTSVGICGTADLVTHENLTLKEIEETEGREEFRKALYEFWVDRYDNGKMIIVFEDECVDCGRVGCVGSCMGISEIEVFED